ncbi:MAG: LysE family translocator [Acidobacteriia bacterium]|nr:LysE family translocator [Terriglobia bacterium]
MMFDAGYNAFVIVAAALVISPGATMAVVTEMALRRGRGAALLTVIGVNVANSSLALASMFGLSAVFHQWPSLLRAVSVCGAVYLTWLGARTLWQASRTQGGDVRGPAKPPAGRQSSAVVRGILTNLLNPSVILFYMLLLPQFIGRSDPFLRRFLLLAATHVCMSIVWLSAYAMAVGTLSERLARPQVRRTMEWVTGSVLVILGVKLILK